MRKVLNIISDTNIGGAGRVLINYMKYYDRQNYKVAVAVPKGSALVKPLTELGAEVIEVNGMADKSMDMGVIKELCKVIKTCAPDLVHTHGSMSGRIAAKMCGVTLIYTRHSAFPVKPYIKKGPGRLLNKWVNEFFADRIIAISPAAAENLTDGGVDPRLIDIMMNGVDPVARLGEEECSALRARWGLNSGDFVTGILARVEDYKGHMDILDAMKILKDKGHSVKLLVAGSGTYEGEVKARTEQLGLSDNVIFLGFVNDVAPVLSVLDVQLNASWGTETSSLSVLEGFSMGLPAVVSDYGGNPQLVDDGVNGYMFTTRKGAELADRLEKLINSPDTLKKMGEGARRIYLERFTGERFAARIEEIYTKTLEEKHRGK